MSNRNGRDGANGDGLDGPAKDWNAAYVEGFDALRMTNSAWRQEAETGKGPPPLKPITLKELLEMELKPRESVLEGLLIERGIAMVYSWRGVGKTWTTLGLNYAIATGGTFLKWKAPKARKVLHIDGEMPVIGLRERLTPIIAMNRVGVMPDDDYFRLLPADYYEFGLPNLATVAGQDAVERVLGDAEVVIFDNVSTLFISGRENESKSWLPVQAWLLKLRRQGRAVIIAHHAGKGKAQRGTSSREDILDVVVNLRRPQDYDPSQGARFEVHFEKARGLFGSPTEPFEAWLQTVRDGSQQWTIRTLEDAQAAEIRELSEQDKSVRQIAEELGMSKSAVQRVLTKARTGQ